LQELKTCFAFLVNPFNVNVGSDGCQFPQPLVTNLSAVEMKLTEIQEDLALNSFIQCHCPGEFRGVQNNKYPEL